MQSSARDEPASREQPSQGSHHAPLARGTFELTTRAFIPRRTDEVFRFFGDAQNLDVLTPPFLHFRVLTPPPIEMRAGTLIDYRLRLRGVPITWRTHIAVWEPGRRFVDEQVRGPYRSWVHTHTFRELDGGTLMDDEVRYRVPGGALVHRCLVERDVLRIFAYRMDALRKVFGCSSTPLDRAPRTRRLA